MEQKKTRANPYQALIDAYEQELESIDVAVCPNVVSQIRMEIRRLRDGVIDSVDLLNNKKVKIRAKVDFPVEQYPGVNFAGKIIGPGAKTLKEVQEKTGTRMSVLGCGSMRNQEKESELLKTGDPKYHHLNERLHLQIDCLSIPSEAYEKISKALEEIKDIITPDPEEMPQAQGAPLSWNDISKNKVPHLLGSNYQENYSIPERDVSVIHNNRPGFRMRSDMTFGSQYGENQYAPKMNMSQRFRPPNPYSRLGNFTTLP